MKLHNPKQQIVRIKLNSGKTNIVLNPKETIDVDLPTRQLISPMISFYGLELIVEDKDHHPDSPMRATSANAARAGATKQVTYRTVEDMENLEEQRRQKDASKHHKNIPRTEERPAVEMEDGTTHVAGDVHLDDEPDDMDDLLFVNEETEPAVEDPIIEEPAEEVHDDVILPEIDTSDWGDGEDEDYAKMVQDFQEEVEAPEVDEIADGSQSIIEPDVPATDRWEDEDKPLPDDDLEAFRDIWDISDRTNEPETPVDIPAECPYTKTQLLSMVKAKLWTIAEELGVDGGGTKRALVDRIIGFYETR